MIGKSVKRNLIPRWRPSELLNQTYEINYGLLSNKINYFDQLSIVEKTFSESPNIFTASELMFLAKEAGNSDMLEKASSFIVSNSKSVHQKHLINIATNVNKNSSTVNTIHFNGRHWIANARKLLSLDYSNPVLLMDLARELTSLGHHQSALRYVRSAVSIAPNSRFIARSSARYFMHIGDYEQAHNILCNSLKNSLDPWIQASEIVIANMIGKSSTLNKKIIRNLLNSNTLGPNYSELASAVASKELKSGNRKIAKDLFKKSLEFPNDNSLAQAEW